MMGCVGERCGAVDSSYGSAAVVYVPAPNSAMIAAAYLIPLM